MSTNIVSVFRHSDPVVIPIQRCIHSSLISREVGSSMAGGYAILSTKESWNPCEQCSGLRDYEATSKCLCVDQARSFNV
ncbi:hypothetical protein A0H81_03249 [Grifola frondosa]|uniref:Uncharacterized protein n=1 Tax=Grifola frondosa TaxID=5627 RepID=A0A1C7MJ73_GRIFR|nr:hypothetical protein A0H81_03249 [Grifola frondosa]